MTMHSVRIVPLTEAHWQAVAAIYREGIDTGMATFEVAPACSWQEWQQGKLDGCSLVALEVDEVVAWAALSAVSRRPCYAGVAEVSVYVRALARGAGVGSLLMDALIEAAEAHGVWTLQATVFPENEASLRLHEKHGFRLVGRRERIAQMRVGQWAGQWRDTLLLERRSRVVGV